MAVIYLQGQVDLREEKGGRKWGGKVKGEGRGNGRRESGEERGGYSALEESTQAQEECVKRVLGKKIALCQQEQNPHMALAVLVR